MTPIGGRKKHKRIVHDWFELTYAQYLVIPRTVLHSMPEKWQEQFVKLLDELDGTFDWRRNGCWVKFKNRKGRFMTDNLGDYQRGRRILTAKQIKEIVKKHNEIYEELPTQKDER